MLISDYDLVMCLIVDVRYAAERNRMAAMVARRGAKLEFFVDGTRRLALPYDNAKVVKAPHGWPRNCTVGGYRHFLGMRGIIRKARQAGARNVLILEDDCVFTPKFDAVVAAATAEIAALGLEWELLYYGANHGSADTHDVSEHVMRVQGSYCTHCMGVDSSAFDAIMDMPPETMFDDMLGFLVHTRGKSYALWPNVAVQKPGRSINTGKWRDLTKQFRCRGKNRGGAF